MGVHSQHGTKTLIDPLGIHCARAYMGGWWYKNCYKTNLNGLYGINSNNQVYSPSLSLEQK